MLIIIKINCLAYVIIKLKNCSWFKVDNYYLGIRELFSYFTFFIIKENNMDGLKSSTFYIVDCIVY